MLHTLLERERGRGRRRTSALQRALVEDFECDELHGRYEIGEHNPPWSAGSLPLSIACCPHAGMGHWAAVSNEEGSVTMLDTRRSAVEQPGARSARPNPVSSAR